VSGPILYGVIVSTLLSAGWGSLAYQVGIFSFLILLVIGVWLLRGVAEPSADHWDHLIDTLSGPPPDRLAPVTAPIEPR
jgi:hypothetical protein